MQIVISPFCFQHFLFALYTCQLLGQGSGFLSQFSWPKLHPCFFLQPGAGCISTCLGPPAGVVYLPKGRCLEGVHLRVGLSSVSWERCCSIGSTHESGGAKTLQLCSLVMTGSAHTVGFIDSIPTRSSHECIIVYSWCIMRFVLHHVKSWYATSTSTHDHDASWVLMLHHESIDTSGSTHRFLSNMLCYI